VEKLMVLMMAIMVQDTRRKAASRVRDLVEVEEGETEQSPFRNQVADQRSARCACARAERRPFCGCGAIGIEGERRER